MWFFLNITKMFFRPELLKKKIYIFLRGQTDVVFYMFSSPLNTNLKIYIF